MDIPAGKKKEIVSKINSNISSINRFFGEGYGKSGYLQLVHQRNKTKNIGEFLCKESSIRLLHETMKEWRMNRRGARLKEYEDFKKTLQDALPLLERLEPFYGIKPFSIDKIQPVLEEVYHQIHLMKSRSKFVANAKMLHFLFPNMLMPMDRSYTLKYFYNGAEGTAARYQAIIEFTFDLMNRHQELKKHLDSHWNTTIPKMIDNAIILLVKDKKPITT